MTESVGTRFKNGQINSVFEAVSIAENVNGAVLRTLYVSASSNSTVGVYTGSTKPTSPAAQCPTVFVGQNTSLSFPLYVPPGQGIWFVCGVAFSPTINATWDVL
jgi:hypothetical protein